MKRRTYFILVPVLWSLAATAGTIPSDGDAWTEYPDAFSAAADG